MATKTTTGRTISSSTSTTTTTHFKVQTQPTKPKRRKYRETTISSSAAAAATTTTKFIPEPTHYNQARKLDQPTIVSPNNTSWCCPATTKPTPYANPTRITDTVTSPPSSEFKIRFLPGSVSPVMDFTNTNGHHHHHHHSPHEVSSFPSSFSKFNSALTAGLLNPMSPPPPPQLDKTRSSPTLFEMMSNEPDIHSKTTQMPQNHSFNNNNNNINVNVQNNRNNNNNPILVQDKQVLTMQRITDLLSCKSPGNQFNDSISSDVKLSLSSKDGLSVSMSVHKQILVANSRFFAVKLSDRWAKQKGTSVSVPCIVEIADCDDVEVYIETLRLMYCKDLRKRLMREDVCRVLGILKVSAAIGFDAGVLSCLEYLEAAPWAEDEEEKVSSLLSELRLEGVGAGEVLKRVSIEVPNGTEETGDNEEVLLKFLNVVLEGKDEKARREMKGLVLKMLRESSSQNDMRKESLYSACDGCLQLLYHYFLQAAAGDLQNVGQIARQADNLHWILDILIDRQIAEDFLRTWASQSELSEVHSKVPAVHRYEISRVTARLFVAVGKGQLLASKDARFLLLQTWLVPFYDDFGWMRRASKGFDRHLVEDALSNTILTLPLAWQQEILLGWFNRFLNSGEECPNIQRGFEIWWRRAFWRRNGEQEQPRQLRIATATTDNS
ncbi:hypothetical protein CFOL_v3_19587 [Cephalotus follicularis]|uniref:BTB domain-containing protein n=1 Tax=Cephalotus follicularis TaxID=3775 RepID=A0A1Q3C7P4_CEPFO|nr:hypothetical protein CFOL_v3_19587 [Cephalotus follicularis]